MTIPGCLRQYYELASYYLRGGMLVAVAEAHNKKHGRVLCQHLLEARLPGQFFIEYHPSAADAKVQFSSYSLMGGFACEEGTPIAEIEDAFGDGFAATSEGHEKPDLKALSAIAVHCGIEVVPADPGILDPYAGYISLPSRDEKAAQCIAEACRLKTGRGGLILWGEDHFVRHPASVPFADQGLHKLIRKEDPGLQVMVVNVANLDDPI